ncbi:hypothetical protein OAJ51_00465 [Pseudomonadota bacterium]|nr:hypothetical protein [Pseudomonadota bacterium]|tara:strand:+ start:1825 stop:2223 length:399 start_codon:yes stop_codon:yes gene_type:complete
MTKTIIFSFFIFFTSFSLKGTELVNKSFKIKSHYNAAQLNLKAESATIRIVRDYAFLSAVGSIKNKNLNKECWKEYITNKKIVFDVSQVNKKILKKTNKFHHFEVTFDPKLVNLSSGNKEGFLSYCSQNLKF